MQNQKITQTKNVQTPLAKQAYEAKKSFKINLTCYAIVNSILVAINMATIPSFPWFLFPMSGWGFGLTMHYIFGVRLLGKKSKAEQATLQI